MRLLIQKASFLTDNLIPLLIMVRTRLTAQAKAPPVVETASFSMLWPDELETALIDIIRRYIEGGKLADNVFKKSDHTAIALELQPLYVSLGVGPATNVISGIQIKGHIDWVSVSSPDSTYYITNNLLLVQEEIQAIVRTQVFDWFRMERGFTINIGRGGALGRSLAGPEKQD